MGIKNFVTSVVTSFVHPHCRSNETFIKHLKKTGVRIGVGTYFFDPSSVNIDVGRRDYISIGDYCCITHGCQFLCHDYSWTVLQKSNDLLLPDPGRPINIGNNVFLGWNTIIIGPVTIGDNVIVGAHSVVTKDLESNSVYAGNPARKISTLDEYLEKRKNGLLDAAVLRATHVQEITGRSPTIEEMGWFSVLFLPRNEETRRYLKGLSFKGGNGEAAIETFFRQKRVFDSFEKFLEYVSNKQHH